MTLPAFQGGIKNFAIILIEVKSRIKGGVIDVSRVAGVEFSVRIDNLHGLPPLEKCGAAD